MKIEEKERACLDDPRRRDSLKGVFAISDSVLDGLLKRCREALDEIRKKNLVVA